jgi:ATP-dependent DNA ligase
MRTYDKLIELGYEGIIVRHTQAPYEIKRSLWVMKFKGKREDEYKIVGYKEEISIDGTPKKSLGALECISGDGNTFFVGTGFTAEDRQLLWSNKDNLIGKIAKIKYQHLTDRKVPRFPVFTEVVDYE